ncbi:hypothetical protein BP5796_08725 [Coleophoma crateriformis]|uniref:BZIP domain-containing protein n=1 Tax=Coleophoma crateriformis TaxID=565419 RepID=A0A3D8R8U7_9HELO|nr:hypothetical protein BP5796_08725 [Coleophoma crateriformis]
MVDQENTASSKGGFFVKHLWRRSKDKSSAKDAKSMPSTTTLDESNNVEPPVDEVNRKQHRRAQVRKAQLEHRQRKANHLKELEQEIVQLRNMITAVENDGGRLLKENRCMREILSGAAILMPAHISPPRMTPQTELHSFWNCGQGDSLVHTSYDPILKADCLMISSSSSSEGSNVESRDVSVPPSVPGLSGVPGTAEASDAGDSPAIPPVSLDQSDVAVNFILALEAPCRTHFRHNPPTEAPFNPDIPETGHELMASALLYSAAPESAFDFSAQPTECNHEPTSRTLTQWSAPILDISRLYVMSLSLPKGDFEITPVQAWFMMVEKYGLESVMENIEDLKRRIAPYHENPNGPRSAVASLPRMAQFGENTTQKHDTGAVLGSVFNVPFNIQALRVIESGKGLMVR